MTISRDTYQSLGPLPNLNIYTDMDLIHIIAVIALVVIGVFIFRSKNQK